MVPAHSPEAVRAGIFDGEGVAQVDQQSTVFVSSLQSFQGRLHQHPGHRLASARCRPGNDVKDVGDIGWIDIVHELAPDFGQGLDCVCHQQAVGYVGYVAKSGGTQFEIELSSDYMVASFRNRITP